MALSPWLPRGRTLAFASSQGQDVIGVSDGDDDGVLASTQGQEVIDVSDGDDDGALASSQGQEVTSRSIMPRPPRFLWWCRFEVRAGCGWRGVLARRGWAWSEPDGHARLLKVLASMPSAGGRRLKGKMTFKVAKCGLRRTRAEVIRARRRLDVMIQVPADQCLPGYHL